MTARFSLLVASLLLSAVLSSGCTWSQTCTGQEGEDDCTSSLVAENHASGWGTMQLACEGEEVHTAEFAGIADCDLVDDRLHLRLGSGACHTLHLWVDAFTGPGTYVVEPSGTEASDLSVAVYTEPGCTGGRGATLGICNDQMPSACEVTIDGDFTLDEGGDLDVTLRCDRLVTAASTPTCRTCSLTPAFRFAVDDCTW